MPAKKTQSRSKTTARSSDSSGVWKWLFVIGLLVAGLISAFGFTMFDPYLSWILILVGILVGLFFFDSEDVVNFGIRYLLLVAVGAALNSVIAVGAYLTGFFTGVISFLGPIALTMLVVYFWKKYFSSAM